MRIALCQTNPTVGDVAGNTEKILDSLDRAEQGGAGLAVFPELSVIGYPPKDLLLKPDVIERCERAVARIAERCTALTAIVGYPRFSTEATGRALHNTAAVCAGGEVVHRHVKHLLPTYDVFDETRYFEPGPRLDLTELSGVKLGISVCEDLWNDEVTQFSRRLYHDNPIAELAGLGAELFVNTSASPFVVDKWKFRREMLGHTARRYGLPIVYVNQVGGNDELIFDGNSCVLDATGRVIAQARDFEEDLLIADAPLAGEEPGAPGHREPAGPTAADERPTASAGGPGDRSGARGSGSAKEAEPDGSGAEAPASSVAVAGRPANRVETPRDGMAAVYEALVLGLGDYCRKCGFDSVVVGLSGGIDSAVSAALCAATLGPERVTGITMPSRYSSEGSWGDSEDLAERLGITLHTAPIEGPHAAMERTLAELFDEPLGDITAQNVQARLRGVLLMAYSNQRGAMLVSTGNKSELAVGYCTLYGDMAGGMAVLSDVPKMMVYELAEWMNTEACPLHQRLGGPPVPENTIQKAPSAELRPDQTDQDNLPPYPVLDQIVEQYVERHEPVERIVERIGYDAEAVRRVVVQIDRNEYKRKQAAPGLKITGRAFGFGRRMPIAQGYDPAAE